MGQLDPDKKYVRWGRLDYGRFCDKLVTLALRMQDGDVLPPRWRMGTPEEFLSTYGKGYKWSHTQNYQLLIYDGVPQFRIWTRSQSRFAWVDLNDNLAKLLPSVDGVEDIPAGNLLKCKPFTKRIKVTDYYALSNIVTCAQYLNAQT